MSNNVNSPSGDKVAWRKRIYLKRETLANLQTDGARFMRSESRQIEWIVEQFYKGQGDKGLNNG